MNKVWTQTSLGEICVVDWGNTKLTKKSFIEDGEFLGVSAAGCDGRIGHFEHRKYTPVLSAIGAKCGRMFFPDEDFTAIKNTITLTPKGDSVDGKFLFHLMTSVKLPQRGAGQPFISKGDIQKFIVRTPPLPEQRRIVAILDEAFEAIEKAKQNAERNLANARELFESYLNRVFTEKGEGWEEKNLADVALQFGRGKSRHRPRNDKSLYGGDYPFVQTGEIRNSDHYVTKYSKTYNEKGLAQSRLWPSGTLCITIAANIAETAILTFDACIPDSVIGLVCDSSKANVEFVEYLLQHFKSGLQAEGKGAAQDNINMGTFERMQFPFPDVSTQTQIVDELDSISSCINDVVPKYTQKLLSLDELKQSILQKAFTGQLTAKSPELEAVP